MDCIVIWIIINKVTGGNSYFSGITFSDPIFLRRIKLKCWLRAFSRLLCWKIWRIICLFYFEFWWDTPNHQARTFIKNPANQFEKNSNKKIKLGWVLLLVTFQTPCIIYHRCVVLSFINTHLVVCSYVKD